MTITEQIFIHDVAYNVTVKQYKALRRLRLIDTPKVLWMDVVCIDQANMEERAHQVSIMGAVYAGAARTDVWLGEFHTDWSTPVSDEAWKTEVEEFPEGKVNYHLRAHPPGPKHVELMDSFEKLASNLDRAVFILYQLTEDNHFNEIPFYTGVEGNYALNRQCHDAERLLTSILERPWWSRVWVLQEVLLCKGDPVVLIGPVEIPFGIFLKAAGIFFTHIAGTACCRECCPFSAELLERLLDLYTLKEYCEASKPGEMSILQTNTLTSSRKATDARDFVYAVLGLLPEDDRPEVDYTISTAQVFASRSLWWFESRANFVRLELGGLPGAARTPGLPTWCIDWANIHQLGYEHSATFEMVDEAADPDRTIYGTDLVLVANHLAKIDIVLERNFDVALCWGQNDYNILWSWLEALKTVGIHTNWFRETEDEEALDVDVFMYFFTTIFRDTRFSFQPDGDQSYTVRRFIDSDWLDIGHWWHALNWLVKLDKAQKYPAEAIQWGANAFLGYTRGSTLAVTTDRRLCMVPEDTSAGDFLYHIRACPPVMVLREIEEKVFQVVGPGYMKGSMGSEGRHVEDEVVITLK